MTRLRPPFPELEIGPQRDRLTHYLVRYPAKFHPAVAKALLDRYCDEKEVVLDPFCGSGTLLVESAVDGRPSIGVDVDPFAVAVARAKVQRSDPSALHASAARLQAALKPHRRTDAAYEALMHADLSPEEYEEQVKLVASYVPAIPKLTHWFRNYVIVDLAHIRAELVQLDIPETHRGFLAVVFASIIRNASNADPVPVSGLEVTKWMRERDRKGRLVNPFAMFDKALRTALVASEEFVAASKPKVSTLVKRQDATQLTLSASSAIGSVVTSPPYHGAVDYYRRHQLEMFWLGQTASQADRLDLLEHYVGRPKVPARHKWVAEPLSTALAKEWESEIRAVDSERANAFRHYLTAMHRVFRQLSDVLPESKPAVFVVGHSSWNRAEIPTTELFEEIAGDWFELDEVLQYDVKNRYMSYSRHNDADISREYVVCLRRTGAPLVD